MLQSATLANAINSTHQRNDLIDKNIQKLEQFASGKMTPESSKQVAQEFESLFISQMLEHMFSGDSMGESLFGNSETDDIYKKMMVDEYSKAIVSSGGIGIAGYIEQTLTQRAILSAQEVAS